jgi:hypothetical protein
LRREGDGRRGSVSVLPGGTDISSVTSIARQRRPTDRPDGKEERGPGRRAVAAADGRPPDRSGRGVSTRSAWALKSLLGGHRARRTIHPGSQSGLDVSWPSQLANWSVGNREVWLTGQGGRTSGNTVLCFIRPGRFLVAPEFVLRVTGNGSVRAVMVACPLPSCGGPTRANCFGVVGRVVGPTRASIDSTAPQSAHWGERLNEPSTSGSILCFGRASR